MRGETKTFTFFIFPIFSQYEWILDGEMITANGMTFNYTAVAGNPINHTLMVNAKSFIGTDTKTWNILDRDALGTIDSNGGTVEVTNQGSVIEGASVSIPQGALQDQTTISITVSDVKEPFKDGSVPAGEAIEFGPEGTIFDIPVTLAIPYNDIDGTIYSEDEIGARYFNASTNQWEDETVIDRDKIKKIIYVETNHFSTHQAFVKSDRLSTKFSDPHYALLGKITSVNGDVANVQVTFYNTTKAWVQLTPNFDDPNYVDYGEVILVPPIYFSGYKVTFNNVPFLAGQHLQFDIDPNQLTPLLVTAVDLCMRGIFGTRLNINSPDLIVNATLKALSSAGGLNHINAMVGYMAKGDGVGATQEAISWLRECASNSTAIKDLFNQWGLSKQLDFILGKTFENLLQMISLPNKYVLLKELAEGFIPALPPSGYVRIDYGYTISGRVVQNNVGLEGVTVTCTGTSTSTVTTGTGGSFEFINATNGSYNLTFSKEGYTFSPSSVPVTVNNNNFVVPDVIATPIITDPITQLLNSLVTIPASSFMMGSTDNEYGHAQYTTPVHQVTLQSFDIGRYEVTQAQYQAVMGTNPSYFKAPNYPGSMDRPVETVYWYEARQFCTALSALTGRTFTLPSEAQWEYACRAGTTTLYSWGDSDSLIGDYAWWYYNSNSQTHPVGTRLPNPWGLYNMHGNVWEWCLDSWHTNYVGAPNDGSAWEPDTGTYPVFRGGGWSYDDPRAFRSAYRDSSYPAFRSGNLGFRVLAVR